MTKTKADTLYESLANFTTEEGAIECGAKMRDYARELEHENAKLKRENHALRADKVRLDWLDSIPCKEKWQLNLAHKCVFLCRNSTSGKDSIREAIDSVLPNA